MMNSAMPSVNRRSGEKLPPMWTRFPYRADGLAFEAALCGPFVNSLLHRSRTRCSER